MVALSALLICLGFGRVTGSAAKDVQSDQSGKHKNDQSYPCGAQQRVGYN